MKDSSLNRLSLSATLHCLTGCSIGEILGMVIGTALGWGNLATIVLAVVLAFFFGYSLTLLPLLRSGLTLANGTSTGLRLGHALDRGDGDCGQRRNAYCAWDDGGWDLRPLVLGESSHRAGRRVRRGLSS